jgi:hypothetical protein
MFFPERLRQIAIQLLWTSTCEYKHYTDVPGTRAEQRRSFPASAIIVVNFVFYVFLGCMCVGSVAALISGGQCDGRIARLFRLRDSAINGTLKNNLTVQY